MVVNRSLNKNLSTRLSKTVLFGKNNSGLTTDTVLIGFHKNRVLFYVIQKVSNSNVTKSFFC